MEKRKAAELRKQDNKHFVSHSLSCCLNDEKSRLVVCECVVEDTLPFGQGNGHPLDSLSAKSTSTPAMTR